QLTECRIIQTLYRYSQICSVIRSRVSRQSRKDQLVFCYQDTTVTKDQLVRDVSTQECCVIQHRPVNANITGDPLNGFSNQFEVIVNLGLVRQRGFGFVPFSGSTFTSWVRRTQVLDSSASRRSRRKDITQPQRAERRSYQTGANLSSNSFVCP